MDRITISRFSKYAQKNLTLDSPKEEDNLKTNATYASQKRNIP